MNRADRGKEKLTRAHFTHGAASRAAALSSPLFVCIHPLRARRRARYEGLSGPGWPGAGKPATWHMTLPKVVCLCYNALPALHAVSL